MANSKRIVYQKPSCTTCRKAKALLQDLRIDFASHDLDKERLSESELDQLIGVRDYKGFLNTRNELYRSRNMSEHPPSRSEALKLMAKEPNLIRRPLLVSGSQIIIGFDEDAYRKLSRT
ncbi:MAG TPA: Spx/MgsR family RNA polymerase-binding regulatory protein [Candidatus Acidoferrum sp.]|nr:Spx/MgsR family RNA polymerase-binding regulatory protein [Candidatus Acidoferrum sp.]